MKKIIPIIVVLALFIPMVTYAFSWSDLMWWKNKTSEAVSEVIELSSSGKMMAEEKLAVWMEAYKADNLSLVTRDERYLTISEAELDYILQEQLKDFAEPPIQDLKIDFIDNKIDLSGYALKPLKGKVSMEVRLEVMEDQLYFHVNKARYKGFFIPNALVGRLIYGYFENVSDFFFNESGVSLQDIDVTDDKMIFTIE